MLQIDKTKNRISLDNENVISFTPMQNYIVARIIKVQPNMTIDGLNLFFSESLETFSLNYEECDSLINFPGTRNPLLANVIIDVVNSLGLPFKIVYDHENIEDVEKFQTDVLSDYCKDVDTLICKNIGDFKVFNMITLLPNRDNKEIINPIRYFPLSSSHSINLDTYNLSLGSIYMTNDNRVASISHLKN